MRPLSTVLLAGAIVAGLAGLAAAEIKNTHLLTVRLPDGSIEQIRYTGDTPPRVSVNNPAPFMAFAPIADPFGDDPAFVALARMSAAMDQQADAMLHQVADLPRPALNGSGGLMTVDATQLPPGVSGYSFVSTISGSGVCTQSMEYTSAGNGQAPKILTKSSGDCGATPSARRPAVVAAPAPAPAVSEGPRMTQASYHPPVGAPEAKAYP
jgi:hypothetical protein